MTSLTVHPTATPDLAASGGRPGKVGRAVRLLTAAALVTLSVMLVLGQEAFRIFEARVMTAVLKPFLGHDVFAFQDQFVIKTDPSHYLGLQITIECTTLVLLVPTLLFAAVMIGLLPRVTWVRWAVGLAVGLALIVTVNLTRIAIIAFATLIWDHDGYEWSHLVVGTVFALIGIVATLIIMLRIMTGRRNKKAISSRSK
ncbi:exosortase/archaeosortase family protein [Leifsonia sp. LS-T14]|uniref:exosortase/archaeosortase family protein n=1 Tax=unclassified Leifsonia TaxID=2663824 RepID=UPI0035A63AF2